MHEINDEFLEFISAHSVSFRIFTTEAKGLNNQGFDTFSHLVFMFGLLAHVSVVAGVGVVLFVQNGLVVEFVST